MDRADEAQLEAEANVIRSPELPYVASIPGGLFPGRAILVKGVVLNPSTSEARRFGVDLCCGLLVQGDHMDNKALHFNPRFEKGGGWFSGPGDADIVINSLINNQWGPEERFPNGFEEGKAFTLRILALEGYYKITVNGKYLCDYAHRVPLDQVKSVFVGGCVRLDYIEFQPALSANANGIPQVVPSLIPEPKLVAALDKPLVPVHYRLANGFLPHHTIQITLTPFLSGERFTVNFMRTHEWIFHFRVDMPQHKQTGFVVRNSTRDGGKWLKEERSVAEFPFAKGITTDVLFTAFGNAVAVDIDGVPFVKFDYREGDNPSEINELTVVGDVVVHRLVHKA